MTVLRELPNVALTGKFRSGKDAVGAYLAHRYGYARYAFGDELKADFHRRYPEIPRNPKPRLGYQAHGQLMRAYIGEDVWVAKCFAMIDADAIFATLPVVITDLRQPNEFSALKAAGYVVIRVNATEETRIKRATASGDAFDTATLTHDTESHVDTFAADYDVSNDGTLAELYAQIDAIMAMIKAERGEEVGG
jgi:dephospho-CoA kinase